MSRVDEIIEEVWDEHGDEFSRKTIGVDVSYRELIEPVIEKFLREKIESNEELAGDIEYMFGENAISSGLRKSAENLRDGLKGLNKKTGAGENQ